MIHTNRFANSLKNLITILYRLFLFYVVILNSQAQTLQRFRNTPAGSVADMAYNDQYGLFIAGSFDGVGINTGAVALFNVGSDIPDFDFPRFYDAVNDIIPDGTGGWYLAVNGNYESRGINENDALNYASRKGVIHVLANNQIDPAFNFDTGNLPINWVVSSGLKLALKGNTLYVFGSFSDANYGGYFGDGTQYTNVLAANASTGMTIDFPRFIGVQNMLLYGNTLYLAGNALADGTRQLLNKPIIALDLTTKTIRNWNPVIGVNRVLRPDGVGIGNKVIIGYQGSVENDPAGIAAFDTTNGVSNPNWMYQGSSDLVTSSLGVDANRIYLSVVSAIPSGKSSIIRIFNVADGSQPVDWNPNDFQFFHPSLSPVSKLYVAANKLYVAGFFQKVNGQVKQYLASINLLTKTVDPWNPQPQPNTITKQISSYQNKLVLLNQGNGVYQYKESQALALVNPTTQELIPKSFPFLPTNNPDIRFWLTKIATTGNVLWANIGSGTSEAYYSLGAYNLISGQ